MIEIIFDTNEKSIVQIGQGFLENAQFAKQTEKQVVITDKNVFNFYKNNFHNIYTIILEAGENSKNLLVLSNIWEKFLEFGVDRSWEVIAVGGGVVSDITGIAAALYMRGLKISVISSTLLAHVDASVGGKNGINFGRIKNLIGVIRQPYRIQCDINLLSTLTYEELLNGYWEILKMGFLSGVEDYHFFRDNKERFLRLENKYLTEVIHRSVSFKKSIVDADEKERGIRKILNFGHTFGHAFEATFAIKHGYAIALGMCYSLKLSIIKGYMKNTFSSFSDIFKDFLIQYLPIIYKEIDVIYEKLAMDKKKKGEEVEFIFLKDIGKPIIKLIKLSELKKFLKLQTKEWYYDMYISSR